MPVSMAQNDLIDAKSRDIGEEGGLQAPGFSLVVTLQKV